jgi:hypothetical protein
MANVSKATGLIPVGHLLGLDWSAKAREYYIPSSDTNAYAIGDPVTLAATADTNGVPGIIIATAGTGNPVLGAIVGWGAYEGLMADPANLNSTTIPATKTKSYYAMVSDDSYIIYEIQAIGSAYTATDVGNNCQLTSGTNNGYVSGWQLNDAVTSTSAATAQLQLLGLARRLDNAFGLNAKYLVRINNHPFNAGIAGV